MLHGVHAIIEVTPNLIWKKIQKNIPKRNAKDLLSPSNNYLHQQRE